MTENQKLYTLNLISGTTENLDFTNEEDSGAIGKIITGKIDGEEKLFWYQEGNIMYSESLNGTIHSVFKENQVPDNLSREFLTVGNDEFTYLLWKYSGQDEYGNSHNSIYCVKYENGSFGTVYKLADLEDGLISSLSAYLNSEGNIALSYNLKADEVSDEEARENIITETGNLKLIDVTYNDSDVVPGHSLPMELTISNIGNVSAESAELIISSYSLGEEFRADLLNLNLQPGETKVIQYSEIVLPQFSNPGDV